jgi:hypothetical protein
MIQPQHAQRGTIGEHHGLTRLTTTLEALAAGQRKQETRDSAIQAQLATQAVLLTQAVRWGRFQLWAIVGLGVLVLTLAGLVGWPVWHPPEQGYARALGALDATLAQQWGSLPKPVQASLTRTYGRRGWTSPGDRQGARQ